MLAAADRCGRSEPMSSRGEDMLVGLVALALLPLIALRIWRGLRDGRLPVYRTYLERDEHARRSSPSCSSCTRSSFVADRAGRGRPAARTGAQGTAVLSASDHPHRRGVIVDDATGAILLVAQARDRGVHAGRAASSAPGETRARRAATARSARSWAAGSTRDCRAARPVHRAGGERARASRSRPNCSRSTLRRRHRPPPSRGRTIEDVALARSLRECSARSHLSDRARSIARRIAPAVQVAR